MTIIMCPSNDDNHGEFPHRLVITFVTIRQRDEKGILRTVTRMGPEFVICAHCDHWVERSIPSCQCRNQCHQQAYLTREQARRKRYRSVTLGAV